MTIWGKVLGGAAGFALGGPIGAIVGVAAGTFVDRAIKQRKAGNAVRPDSVESKRQIFAIALIVLCAKMAKADGKVTRDEIEAFKTILKIPDHEMKQVGVIFDEARREATGFEPYAEQIVQIFPDNNQVREGLLAGLMHIAKADGVVHATELNYLKSVAQILKFSEQDFERIFYSSVGSNDSDPYQILGVEQNATNAEIKTAYRNLIRKNHPDALTAAGLPKEMIDIATEKVANINDAYDKISKLRGIK